MYLLHTPPCIKICTRCNSSAQWMHRLGTYQSWNRFEPFVTTRIYSPITPAVCLHVAIFYARRARGTRRIYISVFRILHGVMYIDVSTVQLRPFALHYALFTTTVRCGSAREPPRLGSGAIVLYDRSSFPTTRYIAFSPCERTFKRISPRNCLTTVV